MPASVRARNDRTPALAAEQSSDDIRGYKPVALRAPRPGSESYGS